MGSGWSQDEASQSSEEPGKTRSEASHPNEEHKKAIPSASQPSEEQRKTVLQYSRPPISEDRETSPQLLQPNEVSKKKMSQASEEHKKTSPQASRPNAQGRTATSGASHSRDEIKKQDSQKSNKFAKENQTTMEMRVPHNFEATIKDADVPIDKSSMEKLYAQLYAGIFLNQKRKKYWVERKTNNNCFMLFARELLITWSDDARFWHWPNLRESSDVLVDVAELRNVCWLEVHGRFETSKLSPSVMYKVIFVVMLRDPAYGWEVPINLRLVLPDGSKQERKQSLMQMPREQWLEIPAGEFWTSPEKLGEIEFSLYEYEGGEWKKGLVIKGVSIQPKD